jgi:hypothetical protein
MFMGKIWLVILVIYFLLGRTSRVKKTVHFSFQSFIQFFAIATAMATVKVSEVASVFTIVKFDGEASIARWLARTVVEPVGVGFFLNPSEFSPLQPQPWGFNNPFSREGVWWAGSAIVKVLWKMLLCYY